MPLGRQLIAPSMHSSICLKPSQRCIRIPISLEVCSFKCSIGIVIDWDDIRYFLAVVRGGSVRAGAEHLGVRHSTVIRRLSQLEETLGTRLFDRLPSGYRLTAAGADALDMAEQMDSSSHRLEALVLGRDQTLEGTLRVTMTSMLVTHLLMPDIAEFMSIYPDVELDLLSSDEPANLTNREADVAVRVVYDFGTLPLNLHGLKGPELFGGVYLSRDLLAAWAVREPQPLRWILKPFDGIPAWALHGSIPVGKTGIRVTDAGAHIAALRHGLGVTTLPCFVGDTDPALTRVPGTGVHRHGSLYLLTQSETRGSRRVRLFVEFIASRLAGHAELLAGRKAPAV